MGAIFIPQKKHVCWCAGYSPLMAIMASGNFLYEILTHEIMADKNTNYGQNHFSSSV